MTATTSSAMLQTEHSFNNNMTTVDINVYDLKPVGLVSPDPVMGTISGILVVIMVLVNLVNVPFFIKGDGTCLKPATLYIIGLMIADLGIALVCQTMMTVVVYLGRWPFSYISCSIYNFFRLILENTGVWIMVLISLDKLQLLCYDYPRYVRVKRKPRIIFEIMMTFFTPMLFHLGGIIVWIMTTTSEERAADHSPDCQDIPAEVDIPFVVLGATVNIFIPGLTIMIINSVVFYKIKQRLKKRSKIGNGLVATAQNNRREVPSSSQGTSSQSYSYAKKGPRQTNPTDTRNRHAQTTMNAVAINSVTDVSAASAAARGNHNILAKKNYLDTEYRRYIRPAVTLAGLVATFSICWFPLAIYHIYVHVFCPSCFDITTQLWLRCLMYANSALNPFIYMATNRKIRKFHAKMFQKIFSSRTVQWE